MGAVLGRSDGDFADDPFENYLRALIYLELREHLDHTSQTEGDIETAVRMPAVTTPAALADAIERVGLERDGTEVTVRVSNLSVTATRAGERVEHRETAVTVTTVTPVLEMHDRVTAYQHAVDEADVTEPGFKQRFNARTYAIGWARGWAQNYQAPVGEVLANRHIEPSANAALYRTQQDIFGAADPNLKNAVRLGWACMALKDGQAMFEEYTATDGERGNSSLSGMPDAAGRLCNSAHAFYDRVTQREPDLPEMVNVLDGQSPLQQTETVAVDELAALPLAELADGSSGDSFEQIVQRMFTIEGQTATETDVRGELQLDVDCRPGYSGSPISRDGSYTIREGNRTESDREEQYYRYTAEIGVRVSAERVCAKRDGNATVRRHDTDSYTLEVATTIGESEANPAATVDDVNPRVEISQAHKYTPGPESRREAAFNNYDGTSETVTEALLDGTDTESYRAWLEERMATASYERGPPRDSLFETTETVELDYQALLGDTTLFAELVADVEMLQEKAANVSVEVARRELVTGNPMGQLLDRIQTDFKATYIEKPSDTEYENVREKVIYEARYAYYQALLEQLNEVASAHETATGELDDRLTDIDGAFANTTRFLSQGLRESDATPDAFPTSKLTGDISYEISGSPTYLHSTQTVDTDQVPAVDQTFAPLRTRNVNAVDLPYETVVNEVIAAVLKALPGMGAEPDAKLSFRMAGDVLSAGELALEAHQHGQEAGRQHTYLDEPERFERDITEFAETLNGALDTFREQVAKRTVTALYPSPATDCTVYAPHQDGYPGPKECASAHGSDIEQTLATALSAAEDGVERALKPYNTAKTARLIGDGNATQYIVDNITNELAADDYRDIEQFEGRYEADQWDSLVAAAVKPAVMTASKTSVEIGSVEQVESLDRRIQEALGQATTAVVDSRVTAAEKALGQTVSERWLGNTDGTVARAARVPAGLPLLPVPGQWVATANAWTIEVAGEYARFEVSARLGTPTDGSLTYVRENRTVRREIGGQRRRLGSVEPIAFDTQTVLVVVTPPGVGVGDRSSENPECSPTYPHIGEVDPDQTTTCAAGND
ncbi:DUF7286 family protein [Halovenus salina]|uniref:Uncharacterized protein n=1 Tax=Halovenus salina TaxID=1510225 RepID=A0ABD5W3F0_9EURY